MSKFSAWIVPGIDTGVPLYGDNDDDEPPLVVVVVAVAVIVARSKLKPLVSASTVICCVPAPSVTGTETVVQLCQSPVAGIETVLQTLLAVLNPRCSEAPVGEATRTCTM